MTRMLSEKHLTGTSDIYKDRHWCDECGKIKRVVYQFNGQMHPFTVCDKCLEKFRV